MLPTILKSKGWPSSYWKSHYSDLVQNTSPSNLIAYYPLDELAGSSVASLVNSSGNILWNGGFECITAPNTFKYHSRGSVNVTQETTITHGGMSAVKIISSAAPWNDFISAICDGNANRNVLLTPGTTYTLKFWTRGDGTHATEYGVYDNTHTAWITTQRSTGVSSTTYTQVTTTFTVPAGCLSVTLYFYAGSTNGSIGYYDDIELIAPTTENPLSLPIIGAPIMGEIGIGDGRTSMYFDGIDDGIYTVIGTYYGAISNEIYRRYLISQKLTISIWLKPWNASMWTEADAGDSTTHNLFGFNGWKRDATSDGSIINLAKWGSENNILSGFPSQTYAGYGYDASWFHSCLTWSFPNDRIRQYFNGLALHPSWQNTGLTSFGTTQGLIDSIGIGVKENSKNQYWKGWLAHVAIWDCELISTQIRHLALR